MRNTIEKLWNEYFAEECATLNSKEERELVKMAGEINKSLEELLTSEQKRAVEKYIEALYEIQSVCVKRAFFTGCEFAMAFFLEVADFKKG